ncbi:MAG TPA: hypothetical protein PLF42_09690 [Anaerolineales bacterium]|nr:hypothetical protein [Anaerolineales bacterium]
MLSSRKELFRPPTVLDKLSLLQTLLEADEVNEHLGLAILKVIHRELSARTDERAAYRRYAAALEYMRHRKRGLFRQVVDAWRVEKSEIPEEWFSSAATDD